VEDNMNVYKLIYQTSPVPGLNIFAWRIIAAATKAEAVNKLESLVNDIISIEITSL
jgi:hypothetical protein